MPIISPTAISPHRIGGKSWSSYWATLNLKATVISDTRIDLTWTGNALVTVQRSTDGVTYADIDTATNGYSDTGLTANTLYYYRLKGGSTYSDHVLAIPYVPYVLRQDFDTIGDFTVVDAPATLEVTTDYYIDGAGALRITTGATKGTIDFSIPNIKFTNSVGILVKLFRTADSAAASSFIIFLSTTSSFAGGTWTAATITGYEGNRDQATYKSGWNNILIKRSDFTSGTPTLLDNPNNAFTTIRLQMAANKGPNVFDSIRFGGPQKPTVLLMFDDADDSLMTVNEAVFGAGKSAFNYMVDNGIPATIYVISSAVDTANYLTSAQLSTAYTAGWDMGNHTETHTPFIGLTDEQITAELATCKAFLDGKGWTRGSNHVAYPGGQFTLDTHPALLESLGYLSARSINATLQNIQYNIDNIFGLWAMGVSSTVTAANVTAKVDEIILSGRMFALYIHALGTPESASEWDPAKFKTVVDYLVTKKAAGEIEVLTISEWYKLVI